MSDERPVALVTGGAKRLGAQFCLKLAEAGWDLVVNYRHSEDAANDVVDRLRSVGAGARTFGADIAQSKEVAAMFESVEATEGRLDLLVNNVGNYDPKPLAELSVADWDSCIGANLSGAFYCCTAATPLLRASRGQIVNLGYAGVDALVGNPDAVAYQVSKSGLLVLTKSLAAALAPDVRANMLSPGQLVNSIDLPEDIEATLPTGRAGQLDEVADALLWLVGAEYVTGVNIDVAGGYRLALR
jgi:3-oxoacyl-[acyl-carrier protein] reductase